MQDQVNGVDCAFFTQAFASEITVGKDPKDASFSGTKQPTWIVNYFTQKTAVRLKRRAGHSVARMNSINQQQFIFMIRADAVAYTVWLSGHR